MTTPCFLNGRKIMLETNVHAIVTIDMLLSITKYIYLKITLVNCYFLCMLLK
jgi:hypothetical protein